VTDQLQYGQDPAGAAATESLDRTLDALPLAQRLAGTEARGTLHGDFGRARRPDLRVEERNEGAEGGAIDPWEGCRCGHANDDAPAW